MTELKLLDQSKSGGPDKIPPVFLNNCASNLAYPLYLLFNQSLKTGCFPTKWKFSFLTPIFKKGDKHEVINYRPVCLLSTIPKVFEKIVLKKIIFQLNHVISPKQHGFSTGKSTLTNLLTYQNYISDAMSSKCQVDSIYTDLSKAFDKVNHELLLNKLHKFGIGGSLYKWISSYLIKRLLAVKIDGTFSYKFTATSGVPQGSHLGPILFLLFVNDVLYIFNDVQVLMFADDLKLFKAIRNINDCHILFNNLLKFIMWCHDNRLQLNVSKCQIMRFYRVKNPIFFDYSINNMSLVSVSEINDLGIWFDTKLNFIKHIEIITNKALKMLGFILRVSSDFNNVNTVKTLYMSLVRSHIEYNSTVWSPNYEIHSHAIERIQNKFLRYVNFKMGIPSECLNYDNILCSLNLIKLSDRRIISDLTCLYKIINSMFDTPDLLYVISFHIPGRSVTRQYLPYYCSNSTSISQYYTPMRRIQQLGNKYSDVVDIFSTSILTYKHTLLKFFSSSRGIFL